MTRRPTTTTIIIIIIMSDAVAQNAGEQMLRLLTWLSPSFPTGAFAYSHGLEWAVEQGTVRDVRTLADWVEDLLLHGTGRSDAILVRHAHQADNAAALRELADLASALAPSRERAEEAAQQGAAFARAAAVWCRLPWDVDDEAEWPLPVVLGACFRAAGLDEERAALGALHGFVAAQVSAGVRLVPLGQTDGLRALKALEPATQRAAARSRGRTLDEIGGFCLAAELAAMLHETQTTRLFRS